MVVGPLAEIVGFSGNAGSVTTAFTPTAEVWPLTVICKLLYVPAGAEIVAALDVTTTFVKLPVL